MNFQIDTASALLMWAYLCFAIGLSQSGYAQIDREITDLTYKSVDGREIRAVLSLPKASGPFPLVVTVHGGNSEKPFSYLRTMAAPNRVSSVVNALNQEPWAILAVSYRNGFMNLGDEDVIAGIRWGMSLPKIDKERVALIGGSHGGYKVLQAGIRLGDDIRCISAGSPWMVDPITFMKPNPDKPPFSLLEESTRTRLMAQGKALYGQILRREGAESDADEFLKDNSALEQSSKIKVPLLLLTSLADTSVPHVFVEPLYLRMKRQNQDVEIFTVKESPHGFYWGRPEGIRATVGEKTEAQVREEERTTEKLLSFLRKNLK